MYNFLIHSYKYVNRENWVTDSDSPIMGIFNNLKLSKLFISA